MSESRTVRVLVWDENPPHAPKSVYPKSINGAVGEGLKRFGGGRIEVTLRNLDDEEQGVTEEELERSDVVIWWAHARHGEVKMATAQRVAKRVHQHGMGFIALHSAHYAKPFQKVVEGPGHLKGGWRMNDAPESEHIRVCAPWHPIAQGVEDFVIEQEEMYGAPFDVPPPLVTVFQSHFPYDGTTFPSGLCWTVGKGKKLGFTSGPGEGVGEGLGIGRVFYFRPGHETVPTYHDERVQRIITNAVLWCAKIT